MPIVVLQVNIDVNKILEDSCRGLWGKLLYVSVFHMKRSERS